MRDRFYIRNAKNYVIALPYRPWGNYKVVLAETSCTKTKGAKMTAHIGIDIAKKTYTVAVKIGDKMRTGEFSNDVKGHSGGNAA